MKMWKCVYFFMFNQTAGNKPFQYFAAQRHFRNLTVALAGFADQMAAKPPLIFAYPNTSPTPESPCHRTRMKLKRAIPLHQPFLTRLRHEAKASDVLCVNGLCNHCGAHPECKQHPLCCMTSSSSLRFTKHVAS